MLTLLLRLGLRVGEVAAPGTDATWTGVTVRSWFAARADREERLPLPADVGAGRRRLAAARSSLGAPATHVFTTVIAPRRELSGKAVSAIVRRAGRRSGVVVGRRTGCGTTAATELLRFWRQPARGRSGPAARQHAEHRHLRQGRSCRAGQLWRGRGRRVRGERPAWRGGRLSHRSAARWVSSSPARACCSSSSSTSPTRPTPTRSPHSWRCSGPPCRRAAPRPGTRNGSAWCAASPAGAQSLRPGHRGATGGPAAGPHRAGHAVSVFRCRRRRT